MLPKRPTPICSVRLARTERGAEGSTSATQQSLPTHRLVGLFVFSKLLSTFWLRFYDGRARKPASPRRAWSPYECSRRTLAAMCDPKELGHKALGASSAMLSPTSDLPSDLRKAYPCTNEGTTDWPRWLLCVRLVRTEGGIGNAAIAGSTTTGTRLGGFSSARCVLVVLS